jgi:hypothetical protein
MAPGHKGDHVTSSRNPHSKLLRWPAASPEERYAPLSLERELAEAGYTSEHLRGLTAALAARQATAANDAGLEGQVAFLLDRGMTKDEIKEAIGMDRKGGEL